MQIYPNRYHHLFNRSNNNEILFKSSENYLYFLKKFRHYLEAMVDTIAYCLMPTHFHFLIYATTENIEQLKLNIGIWLSSYSKAINKRYQRHGSLFQRHTKAKMITDESYLLTLITYIHQNPVRAGLVEKLEDWPYSSYRDYIQMRKGTLPKTEIMKTRFSSIEEFVEFSNRPIEVKKEYWF